MTHREAREQIAQLVERWRGLSEAQKRFYQEANTKAEFIEPLFSALGWDVHDAHEVSREEQASRGRVDYAFKIRGVTKFYVEAKPLRADLNNIDFARQAITYAWNKAIPWVVLANFEETHIFNAEWETPELALARFVDLSCQRYMDDLDKLWWLSKEAMAEDRLTREATTFGLGLRRVPVERALYSQLSEWREEISDNIHTWNRDLALGDVDRAVHKLLNRLIFIRICEDRGLEDKRLQSELNQWLGGRRRGDLLGALRGIFRYYIKTYDSDLFREGELLDDRKHVIINDEILQDVLKGLYGTPNRLAAYDFSAIDADVLGAVYEQYLGHVTQIARRREQQVQLRLGRGYSEEQAWEEVVQVVQRPRGRKERGIYYTPRWVVDYIVQQTIGKFIEEHAATPDAIHELKVLDMACGSGSFLIRAYDELLKWHAENFGRAESDIDPHERTLILRKHIFGVDLDPQAVEIARLNLLLRALAQREMLPSLADTIRVGNSLISGGANELESYFGDKWQEKRPFGWDREFGQIMEDGGFDVIIGNPPYVRIQGRDRTEASYFSKRYESSTGNYDIYVLFVEQALRLLKDGGVLGFILPNNFFKAKYGRGIRRFLSSGGLVTKVVDFGDAQIFGSGTNYTALLFLKKQHNKHVLHVDAREFAEQAPMGNLGNLDPTTRMATSEFGESPWLFRSHSVRDLMARMERVGDPLSSVADRIFQGLKTSADAVYVLSYRRLERGRTAFYSRALEKEVQLDTGLMRPLIKGAEMRQYWIGEPQRAILFPYIGNELLTPDELQSRFQLTWRYLEQAREILDRREHGTFQGVRWYQFGRSQALDAIQLPKLITPDVSSTARFSWDIHGAYAFSGGGAGGYGIILGDEHRYEYVLGLLNSTLLDWYLHHISTHFRGGYYSYEARFIGQLPIRRIDSGDAKDRQLNDAIVASVDRMRELQARLGPIRDVQTSERDDLQREVDRVDSEIDGLVYELYGLTEAERRLVEGLTQEE